MTQLPRANLMTLLFLATISISSSAHADQDVWPINKYGKTVDVSAGVFVRGMGLGFGIDVGFPNLDHFNVNRGYTAYGMMLFSYTEFGHGPELTIKAKGWTASRAQDCPSKYHCYLYHYLYFTLPTSVGKQDVSPDGFISISSL